MLAAIGVDSLDALIDQTVPAGIRLSHLLPWASRPLSMWPWPGSRPLPAGTLSRSPSSAWAITTPSRPRSSCAT